MDDLDAGFLAVSANAKQSFSHAASEECSHSPPSTSPFSHFHYHYYCGISE